MSQFKLNNTFEKRKSEACRISDKYKGRVPIIVEVNDSSKREITLDKNKYLVPFDLTAGQFLFIIRKRIKIEPEKALFIFFNNTLPSTADTVGCIYKEKKDKDGFLYATISLESTFG